MRKAMKYVLVTGGAASGLGEGVTASRIGVYLQACGFRVTAIKIDPSSQTNAGITSLLELDKWFILDDGGEVGQDLGNYERFLNINLTSDHNITREKIFKYLNDRERKGYFLGKPVQFVPHFTDAIQEWIERVAHIQVDGMAGQADVCVMELGGTIGDMDSIAFIGALGEFSDHVGAGNFCHVHVGLVPALKIVGENESVFQLRSFGLTPDILACRSTMVLDESVKGTLSQSCQVPAENIFTLHDASFIWHLDLLLEQKAHEAVLNVLKLKGRALKPSLKEWTSRAEFDDNMHETVRIAVVGESRYSYQLHEMQKEELFNFHLELWALVDAALHKGKKLFVDGILASDLEEATKRENPGSYESAWKLLKGADGVLLPGGFINTGVQGRILATKYARENKIPFLGTGLGMQIVALECARFVLGIRDANSTEFDPYKRSQFVKLVSEGSKAHMGGTMRLGSWRTYFQDNDCKSAKLYGHKRFIDERHQHRYEVNRDLVSKLKNAGLSFTGKDETGQHMDIVELPDHPFFIGVQFQPEYKSRPGKPSPLFLGLIAAACGELDGVLRGFKRSRN